MEYADFNSSSSSSTKQVDNAPFIIDISHWIYAAAVCKCHINGILVDGYSSLNYSKPNTSHHAQIHRNLPQFYYRSYLLEAITWYIFSCGLFYCKYDQLYNRIFWWGTMHMRFMILPSGGNNIAYFQK